ncbi:integrator complex subunit 3-like isoform X2 [Halichondria panicea]|uniref:integrator complex subunit 3-like isoform X2 n=1 Tax=Halichondria panicea TaxID=6063 RepID=UPI00312BAE23
MDSLQTTQRFEKCHSEIASLIGHLRENEIYNHLSEKVSRSAQDHEETMMALLYAILTDPSSASKSYHTLTLVSRDSLGLVTTHTERIVMEKMMKLQDHTRNQVLWLIRAMVETKVTGAEKLVFALLKQLPAGSTSSSAVLLAENVMHLVLDNKEWLFDQPGLAGSVVYTYLSLLPCLTSSSLSGLREQAAHMTTDLIRTRFDECLTIGRDLVRLLQMLARVPEITELWKDLILNPQKINPQFTGLKVLLSRRTSRRFVAGRILVDAEIKLNFLLSKVKFGQHTKYQEWFQKKYLSTPESLYLIPELIRFICCVIHPTNEILASDVVPRWAVVGWLLSLAQSDHVLFGYSKLSLFFDWLAYQLDSDNIMNIEPAILLMHHSLRSHPQLTATLLDFICRQASHYHPDLTEVVSEGIKNAFRDILQKGVLLSLDPLFESSRLDDNLRALVRETFPELCHQEAETAIEAIVTSTSDSPPPPPPRLASHEMSGPVESVDRPPLVIIASEEELGGEDAEITGAFSDQEDEGEGGSLGFVSLTPQMMEERSSGRSSSMGPWGSLEGIPLPIKDKLLAMRELSEGTSQTAALEELLSLLNTACHEDNIVEDELLLSVAPPLADLLSPAEETPHQDAMTTCLFRHLASTPPTPSLVSLAAHLRSQHSVLGYQFITYLADTKPHHLSPYKELATRINKNNFVAVLVKDMKECVEADSALFYRLLPLVYKQFFRDLSTNHEMLNTAVANIDPAQLQTLMHKLAMKEFQIFGKQTSSIKKMIDVSTKWDSFEQFCVWQLVCAEGPDPQSVIPALTDLNPQDHPEAMSSAMVFLRTESTTYHVTGALLSLPPSLSDLIDAVCVRWISGRPVKYGKLISQFLEEITKYQKTSPSQSPVLCCALSHLQRLLKALPSTQVLEATDMMLARTLSSLFSQDSELSSKFVDLSSTVSTMMDSGSKLESGTKIESGKRSKHGGEPKSKKRKM